MTRLTDYNSKRDFSRTGEPRGKIATRRGNALRFVIQRHDATRLHYDLRLELDGVYKSWAVTKVPSLDPAVKRLAVQVEDHPIDYGTFEGIIPKGEYGGGTVQLWDRGTWMSESPEAPESSLEKGHFKFELNGERMKGGWALVRMKDRPTSSRAKVRHNWLLIKERDAAARPGKPDALQSEVTSVKTGRTLEEIAGGKRRTIWHSKRAEKPAPARKKTPTKKKAARRSAR
jgi:bifunctional non-homologous end joining protein LigD